MKANVNDSSFLFDFRCLLFCVLAFLLCVVFVFMSNFSFVRWRLCIWGKRGIQTPQFARSFIGFASVCYWCCCLRRNLLYYYLRLLLFRLIMMLLAKLYPAAGGWLVCFCPRRWWRSSSTLMTSMGETQCFIRLFTLYSHCQFVS